MKLKKVIKFFFIFILILFILFAGYFFYYKFTKIEEETFISSDFLYVFQTKNAFTLFNKLNESHILDSVFNNRDMKETYKILVDVKSQLAGAKQKLFQFINFPATFVIYKNNKSFLIFNTGMKAPLFQVTSLAVKKIFSDSINFKIYTEKYNDITVHKVSLLSKRQNFYFAQIKNLLIVSKERSTLLKSIKTFMAESSIAENENFLQTRAQIGKGKLLVIFFNLTHILQDIKKTDPKLYENLKTLSILSIAGANLEIDKESVKIDSFYSTDIQDEKIMNLFLSAPKRMKSLNLLPFMTSSFVTLTFDDFQDVWDYFNQILIKTGQEEMQKKLQETQKNIESILNISLNEQLFSWIDDEITIDYIKGFNDPLVFIGIKNKEKIQDAFEIFQKKNILEIYESTIYKDITINQIKLSSFYQFIVDIISSDLKMPSYIIYEDYIILSKDKEVIRFFIDSVEENNNLLKQKNIKTLYSYIKEGNVISYWDLSKGSIGLLKSKNLFTRIIKKYNYGMVSIEFVDRGIKNKIIITEPRTGGIKIVDGWPIYFDSPIWASPVAYNIDNKNLDEIILGTEDGKVYIYDFFGERAANWPVKMASEIKTPTFVFYHPVRNDVFIGAASTSGEINIWNKDGFLLDNFPISIKGSIEKAPIIKDINNDQVPEIILTSDKGQIYVMDINGKSLPGFPVQLEEEAECSIVLIDIDNDKNLEILCSMHTSDGDIFFINNTGAVWDEKRITTGSVNFSSPVVSYFRPSIPNILLVTADGKLYRWNQTGDIVTNFPIELNEKFVNSPAVSDINKDSKKEIILISAAGTLYIINDKGEIISQINLDFRPIENEKIYIFDVNKDGRKEIIIPGTDDFVRFYNSEGAIVFKIKGAAAPFIKDMDKDGKYEVITASDDGNVYLYKMP